MATNSVTISDMAKAMIKAKIKLFRKGNLEEFWDRVFHNPMDIDLSMLDDEEFALVCKDLKIEFHYNLKIDERHKKIRVI